MPYNMINRLTEDIGGQRNASNWVDRTNYYETVPAEYLETMLWTHRERMAFPVVDSVVFEKERDVVKEELRQLQRSGSAMKGTGTVPSSAIRLSSRSMVVSPIGSFAIYTSDGAFRFTAPSATRF